VELPADFKYIAILDFECTCEQNDPTWINEIIEFPVVMIDTKTKEIVAEFHKYVRPTIVPTLTAFCTELTGIKQEWVSEAEPLPIVIEQLHAWLLEHHFIEASAITNDKISLTDKVNFHFMFATDGPWDFNNYIWKEANRLKIQLPKYLRQYMDLRLAFYIFYETKKKMGINNMLTHLNLQFIGRPHAGIDDTRNLAAIATNMMRSGFIWK